MDHLRYSSFDLGFRVFQFLIPFMVVGSCTEILVSWVITHVSHGVARVLCHFLINEVSCTNILQNHSYLHNGASSNNASIPKCLSTEYGDANPPDKGLPPHHNQVNRGNRGDRPRFCNCNIDPVHVEAGMGGNGGNNDEGGQGYGNGGVNNDEGGQGNFNDGGNNDEGGQGNGNGGEGDREEIVIERRTFEGFLIETIPTHLCALDYDAWNQLAGEIFNFWRQRYNKVHLPPVALMDPLICWPGSFPLYGYWNGGMDYKFWDWDVHELHTINNQINTIIMRELTLQNDGANNEEGAIGAQNDVEAANQGAQGEGVDANSGAQNGGVGGQGANHGAQGRGVDANNAAHNEGEGDNAAHNEGEGDNAALEGEGANNDAQNGEEGANNGARIEGEGSMAAQTEGGGDNGAQNRAEGVCMCCTI